MLIRMILLIILATASAVYAQPPGRGGPGGARLLGAMPGMPGRVVQNAPYSADLVTETTQVLADGNRIKQSSSSRFYRDSEGRTRREQSLDRLNGLAGNSSLSPVVFIDDPVAGASYTLNPSNKTAGKFARPQAGTARAMGRGRRGPGDASTVERFMSRRISDSNVKTESLGRQLIEGVPADGTRTTRTIPAGEIGNDRLIQTVTEVWYSPELQTTVLSKRSDPRSGETMFKLTNISRAEPPRNLFDVPVDYKVSESERPFRGPAR